MNKLIAVVAMFGLLSGAGWAKEPTELEVRAAIKAEDPRNQQNKLIRKTGPCEMTDEKQPLFTCPISITYKRKSGDQTYNWKSNFVQTQTGWVVSN